MIMLKVTVEHMQGNGGGNHCLKVVLDNGTRFGETLGFIVPLQYSFEGYWGGIAYFVCSFNENKVGPAEQSFNTLYDAAKHLGVDCDELFDAIPRKEGEPYFHQWEYMNTDFARDLWWK